MLTHNEIILLKLLISCPQGCKVVQKIQYKQEKYVLPAGKSHQTKCLAVNT